MEKINKVFEGTDFVICGRDDAEFMLVKTKREIFCGERIPNIKKGAILVVKHSPLGGRFFSLYKRIGKLYNIEFRAVDILFYFKKKESKWNTTKFMEMIEKIPDFYSS